MNNKIEIFLKKHLQCDVLTMISTESKIFRIINWDFSLIYFINEEQIIAFCQRSYFEKFQ